MLQLTWLVLLGVVLVGYVVGIQVHGVQMLAPLLDHRLPRGRKDTLSALPPVLLIHEAWLISVAVLLAALPWVNPEALSGLLTVLAVWLTGVLVGNITARLRKRATPGIGRRAITCTSATGAAVATAATGWAAGLLLGASALDVEVGRLPVAFAEIFAPLCAAVCVSLTITHGATYLAWRHVGMVAARARAAAQVMAIVSAAMVLAAASAAAAGLTSPMHFRGAALACAVLIVGSLACACQLMRAGRPGRAAAATSISATVPVALVCGLGPQVLASQDPHYPGKATIDPDTLSWLLVLVVVVGPLLVVWGRWALRGESARGLLAAPSWWRRRGW